MIHAGRSGLSNPFGGALSILTSDDPPAHLARLVCHREARPEWAFPAAIELAGRAIYAGVPLSRLVYIEGWRAAGRALTMADGSLAEAPHGPRLAQPPSRGVKTRTNWNASSDNSYLLMSTKPLVRF
jgi:hypothetical protein